MAWRKGLYIISTPQLTLSVYVLTCDRTSVIMMVNTSVVLHCLTGKGNVNKCDTY